jgi:nucleoside-diphosphate-sugar epimerase
MKTILVTGSAGFIGSNLVLRLFKELSEGTIVGLDNLNDYYDPTLKDYRLSEIEKAKPAGIEYEFVKGDLADKALIDGLFEKYKFDVVVNLAAQAGVRYSITNPDAYIQSNMIGFYNILEACRHSIETNTNHTDNTNQYKGVQHLVYASSSSVYGGNKKVPFSTDDRVDNPVSLYAATKKSNELFAHCYSKLYNIPTTGLRFFTVYGPAGRPDMAYFGFTNKLLKGETIQIFNYGNCRRDFTYVDDIVEGVWRVMQRPPASPQPSPKREGEASPKSSPKGKDLGVHTADPMLYGELKRRAEEMRKNPTEAESVLWDALRGNGLGVKFRQQHIIEDFIVDFYCNEYKVTVEIDGGYHKTPEQTASDAERTARLNELGYTELRFTNEEVLCDLDNVLKKIKTFCSGTPSPSGEGLGEAPYAVYNIGGGQPENLLDFVNILQEELVRAGVLPADFDFEAHKKLVPMQPGDVPTTYADATALERDFGFTPKITLREGLRKFAEWYASYYQTKY